VRDYQAVLGTILTIVSIVSALVVGWQGFLRWRAQGSAQARQIALGMRNSFNEIISRGGIESAVVLLGPTPLETSLVDLRDQLHDRILETRLDRLLGHWRETQADAPAVLSSRLSSSIDDIVRQGQRARHVHLAQAGAAAAQSVLERCNQLNRLIVGR
jgi:hypothetical protein